MFNYTRHPYNISIELLQENNEEKMTDKKISVPVHIEAIPYIKDVLSSFHMDPIGADCKSLVPVGKPTKNADGSISHNYTATLYHHGDAGSRTDIVNVSLVEKESIGSDGKMAKKYTLYTGDTTQTTFYDPIRETTEVIKPKSTGKIAPDSALKDVTAEELRAQSKLLTDNFEQFLTKFAPIHLGTYKFHQESQAEQNSR
jgi:hypothetical protein